MSRPVSPELVTYWKIRLDSALAARVEIAMWDNVLKKPKYGSRKALIETLLREWLQREAEMQGTNHASGI